MDTPSWLVDPATVPHPRTGNLGGVYRTTPDDFQVEELALYDPDGGNGHLFLWIEKRNLSTPELVTSLAKALDANSAQIGTAGLKDRRAVSRQWVSIPEKFESRLEAVSLSSARILRVERNSTKLRTGDLGGNRFTMILRDVGSDAQGSLERFLALTGRRIPNYFGPQRFGNERTTHKRGFDLLRGRGSKAQGRMKRLYLSATQSALFNAYLAKRVVDECWDIAIPGDVLLRRSSGGIFFGEPTEAVASNVAVVAGPIFGPHMAPASADARRRECRVLEAANLAESSFERFGKLTAGTRRPLWNELRDVEANTLSDTSLELRFTLRPGSYATVFLESLGVREAA